MSAPSLQGTASQLVLIPDERGEAIFQNVLLSALPPDSQLYGDAPDAAVVESVERFGILQPVILVERGLGYSVADGRNRIKAARSAKLISVPAMVYPNGWAIVDVLTLIANSQRRANAIADLRAIEGLVRHGATEQDMCEATGLSTTELRARMRLQGLIEPMRAAVEAGRIKVSLAGQVAKLSAPLQRQLVETLHKRGLVTGADVKAVTRAKRQDAFSALPPELFDTPGVGVFGDEALESSRVKREPIFWGPRVVELLRRAISLIPEGDPSREWLARTPIMLALVGEPGASAGERPPEHVVGTFDPDSEGPEHRVVGRTGQNGHGG